MEKQALIIGLGQFGMALAQALSERGVEVMAVDLRADRVQSAVAFTADALCLDVTDETSLQRLAPTRRDLCVVAIGDEARESSIMVTAMLRQMGAPRIVARATTQLHERILRLVGAHEVVNPERAYGQRLALRLAHPRILDVLPLGPELLITEVRLPTALEGRSLSDLSLPRRFRITVVAIRREEKGQVQVILPDPRAPLHPGDVLVLIGPEGAVDRLVEEL